MGSNETLSCALRCSLVDNIKTQGSVKRESSGILLLNIIWLNPWNKDYSMNCTKGNPCNVSLTRKITFLKLYSAWRFKLYNLLNLSIPQSSILCTTTYRQFLKDEFACIINVLIYEAIECSRQERVHQGQIVTVYLTSYIKYVEITQKRIKAWWKRVKKIYQFLMFCAVFNSVFTSESECALGSLLYCFFTLIWKFGFLYYYCNWAVSPRDSIGSNVSKISVEMQDKS